MAQPQAAPQQPKAQPQAAPQYALPPPEPQRQQEAPQAPHQPQPVASQALAPLPPGWQLELMADGRVFYFHRASNT
eukprot:7028232-Alexandrium_andersonii.AAC.1